MFETSRDVLNLTLALCCIFISVFLCWLLYYMISTIKKTHDVINFFSKTIVSINEFFSELKQKTHSSMAYFRLFGVLTEKFINYVDKKGVFKSKNKQESENKKNKKTQK